MNYYIESCKCKEIKINNEVVAVKITPHRGYHFIKHYIDEDGTEQTYYIDGYIQIPVDKFDEYIESIESVEVI